MPSFDIVSKMDLQEVDNAVQSTAREIQTRYDFKGGNSSIERNDGDITLLADDDMRHRAMIDMLKTYVTRRNLDAKGLDFGTPEKASGNMIRQTVTVKQGIPQDIGKKINKAIKDSKIKVQC